jgi:hypothetical protein
MPFDGTPPRDDRPERFERELVQAIMDAERAFRMWQQLGVDIRAVTASTVSTRGPTNRLSDDQRPRRERACARNMRSPENGA